MKALNTLLKGIVRGEYNLPALAKAVYSDYTVKELNDMLISEGKEMFLNCTKKQKSTLVAEILIYAGK